MNRTVDIDEMVSLPRLNAFSAVVLAEQFLTAADTENEKLAEAGGLPTLIALPRARLIVANESLKSQIQPRNVVCCGQL